MTPLPRREGHPCAFFTVELLVYGPPLPAAAALCTAASARATAAIRPGEMRYVALSSLIMMTCLWASRACADSMLFLFVCMRAAWKRFMRSPYRMTALRKILTMRRKVRWQIKLLFAVSTSVRSR